MTTSFIILGICLLGSFFFSSSETAFTASSDAHLHEMQKNGNKAAARVRRIKSKPDRFLGVILFGNNIVNILATAVSTSLCIHFFGEKWGVFITTFIVSLIVLIFCEIMPKTFAINNPNSLSLFFSPLIALLTFLFAPFVVFLNTFVRISMKILGLLKKEKTGDNARTELRGAIELQNSTDIASERPMLKSVLDLNEVEIGDIMTHRRKIVSFDINVPIDILKEQILGSPYTRIPLWENEPDNIVGILHTKAFLRALEAHEGEENTLDIRSILTQPWYVMETTSLLKQLQNFRKRREHLALVVDEYGMLQGLVSLEDVLEEIVGDIMDETDYPTEKNTEMEANADGSVLVSGSVALRDLNRHFGWELPDEEASTVAGLLLYETERIPPKGATFTFYDFTFKVTDIASHLITRVLITPPEKEDLNG